MSFNRLEADDFVVSADSITAGLWTDTETPTITTFFTSSTQAAGSSGNYYLNVFSNAATSSLEFAVNYGNEAGSGSIAYNLDVDGKSPSSTIYGQYRTLVLGDENASFSFGGITSSVFQLVSGSAGSVNTSKNNLGYSTDSGSYGWFLPDIATYILNPRALSNTFANGGIELDATLTSATSSVVNPNPNLAFVAIKTGASFTANSQETISSDFVFCRPRSSQFNYSENPSFISGSTGEVIYPLFINSPTTYITTVGLYNDTNELLAVAKLSKPLQKDFTKESLIRVKLDF